MIDNNIYQSFNVSNPETYSINELALITLKALNKEHWKLIYESPELDGQYRKDVSVEKLNILLPGFKPLSLFEGIKRIYNDKISK